MTAATLTTGPSASAWTRRTRDLVIGVVLLVLVGGAFLVGRLAYPTHTTRTVTQTITRYVPVAPTGLLGLDPCRRGARSC